VKPDPDPQNGMFYRSDHWYHLFGTLINYLLILRPFAQIKIPSLFFNIGFESLDSEKPINFILEKNR
jgi:hypothetical protein